MSGIPPLPADPMGVWDWAMKLSKMVQEVAAKKAEARRVRRNERAKVRRAISKRYPKPKPPVEPEWEQPLERCCACHLGHPPCGYCTDGEGEV